MSKDGPAQPPISCYYEAAYTYQEESECRESWKIWDSYCWTVGWNEMDLRCEIVDDAYWTADKEFSTSDRLVTPDIKPTQECFYEAAYFYLDGSECTERWSLWDNYCWEVYDPLCFEVEN